MDPTSAANDANKLSVEDARAIAKKMLIGGFFLLPLLWLINAFYFRRHLSGGDPQVRKYVVWSLIGGSLEFVLLISWYVVFSLGWANWGTTGEAIALIWAY